MSLLQSLPGRWQPWPRGPLLIMTRWQRLAALIASVLSSSPAVLLDSSSSLLFSLLLAQLPVFASASPVPPRRSSDLDRLTNHTTNLKKLAQKLLVSACRRHPPPPPLHTNKTKNNNCMMEKRLLLWLILIGGERILHCTTVTINPLNGFMVIHGFVSGWAIVWLTEFAQVTLRWLYWSGCMLIESPLQIWLWSHFWSQFQSTMKAALTLQPYASSSSQNVLHLSAN